MSLKPGHKVLLRISALASGKLSIRRPSPWDALGLFFFLAMTHALPPIHTRTHWDTLRYTNPNRYVFSSPSNNYINLSPCFNRRDLHCWYPGLWDQRLLLAYSLRHRQRGYTPVSFYWSLHPGTHTLLPIFALYYECIRGLHREEWSFDFYQKQA